MIRLRLVLILCIGVLSIPLQAKPLHLDSIKVYIPFYGNFNDWSGWNNNGQSGRPDLGVDRNGNANRAFAIIDSMNFLAVPTQHTQVPTFTYMQWVRINERPDSMGMTVFETGDPGCRHSLRLFSKGKDSVIMRYQIPFGDGDSTVEMAGRMPDNQWHHLSVLRSKDSVYLYMDVLFNAEFYVPGSICHAGDFIHYGANLDSGQMLHGALDEIRVYSENIEPNLLLSIVQGERLGMDEKQELTMRIYPNPSSGFIQVQLQTSFDEIRLYAAHGQLLNQSSFPLGTQQDLPLDYPPGTYWVEVRKSGRRLAIEQVILR